MMSMLDNPIVNSFLVFLISSLLLYSLKPSIMFKKDGKMKKFGYGKNRTCFTFPVTVFGITLISFIFFKVISSDGGKSKKSGGGRSSKHSSRHSHSSRSSGHTNHHSSGYSDRY